MALLASPVNSVSFGMHIAVIAFWFLIRLLKKHVFVSKIRSTLVFTLITSVIVLVPFFIYSKLINNTSKEKSTTFANQPTKAPLPASEYMAWLPWWDEERVIESISSSSANLSVVSPVWYRLNSSAQLTEIKINKKQEIMNVATNSALLLLPSISNDTGQGFNADLVTKFLSNSAKQELLIRELVETALVDGYAGWDFDWEEIKESDKEKYITFISKTAKVFKDNGLLLSVTVHAKEGNGSDRAGTRGQDWRLLKDHADIVRIMVYDYHNENTKAGAITPSEKLKSVIRYAKSVIPQEKIVIGLPLYGYDWNGSKGKSIQYVDAIKVISENSGEVKRDESSYELIGSYTKSGLTHEVWFQDKASVIGKINIARSMGVYKFSFWRLGGEDYSFWIE